MKFKDQLNLNPLFLIAALFLILIRNAEAARCTANQISSMNVAGCDCQQTGVAQKCPLYAPQCGVPQKTNVQISQFNGGLNLWGQGCLDENFSCNGCYLWFGNLCQCLNHGSCITTPVVAGNPIWVLLANHALITTTQRLPGILELSQASQPNRGWQLGQDTLRNPPALAPYTRRSGALAMNSVARRTEEQIHIHVCDNPNSGLRTFLYDLKRSDYTTLTEILSLPGFPAGSSLWCQVASSPGAQVDMEDRITTYLNSIPNYASNCAKYYVGAGLITDTRDYTWGCITTGTESAEDLFCRFH